MLLTNGLNRSAYVVCQSSSKMWNEKHCKIMLRIDNKAMPTSTSTDRWKTTV